MFDLEKAIATWRMAMTGNPVFSADDIDELESHIRDQVVNLMKKGTREEKAYRQAIREMGGLDRVDSEYQKVFWGKIRRQGDIRKELTWRMSMLSNYLKVALRNLRRQKVFSIINVMGLAIGVAASFLILQYVGFEYSYDQFHDNAGSLYRVTNDRFQNGKLIQHGVISYPSVPKAMHADYPEVVNYTKITNAGRTLVRVGDLSFTETDIIFADSAFFNMFSFPLIVGDPAEVLAIPNAVVISETTAQKYFGTDWMQAGIRGAVLQADNDTDYTVTGVFEDVPANSHMSFDMVVSWKTLAQLGTRYEDSWTNSNYMMYVQLARGADPGGLEEKFVNFSERYFNGAEVTGYVEEFFLQPLAAIHLDSDYEYETWVHGSGAAASILSLVALFILVLAWVNYVNLSTARSLERAKEVGVRKFIGANRGQLIKQFLLESVAINILGFVLAAVIAVSIQSVFSLILDVQISFSVWSSGLGFQFILLLLVGTVASGLYPALLFSSFGSMTGLRGKYTNTSGGHLVRKGLVVFQFAASFALIAGTLVVSGQVEFMQNRDLGMNPDQVLVVRGPRLTPWDSTYFYNLDTFREEVTASASVQRASFSGRLLGSRTGRIFNIQRLSGDPDLRFTTSDLMVDHEFFETLEIDLVAGRLFEQTDHALDWNALEATILNEAAVEFLGFEDAESSIEERVRFWGKEWRIVGVVENHHQQSPAVPVEPIIFTPGYTAGGYIYTKVSPDDLEMTLAHIEAVYMDFFPGNTFDYFFLDAFFNEQYETDRTFGTLFGIFSVLAMLIAAIGLFGLSLFTTAQRTKEIGVRKALGASSASILKLLLREYATLIVAGIILASPITYLAVSGWLENYAYHVDITWLSLALPGAVVVVFAVCTVAYQTMRAALSDPVDSLRYE